MDSAAQLRIDRRGRAVGSEHIAPQSDGAGVTDAVGDGVSSRRRHGFLDDDYV